MPLAAFYTSFLTALNRHRVEYLVVGGQAVNFHGYTRATLDLDIWIGKSKENLQQLEKAFVSMGFDKVRSHDAIKHFIENHKINIPRDNNLIEILDAFILKADFESAYIKRMTGKIEELSVSVIDLETLLEIKSSSTRIMDLNDAEKLRYINSKNGPSEPEEGYTLR
ncbi:MAG: hypothetical protein P1P82_03435 [Bacteroidales bacterium]|nr:hypothetical protein [Bacteroidales bacterium]MDT8431982.1 hypothetical protein [Bacteroidales bacterium]